MTLNFRRHAPPPWISPKDQLRLLLLLGLLVLVLVAMRIVGRDSTWRWMAGVPQRPAAKQQDGEGLRQHESETAGRQEIEAVFETPGPDGTQKRTGKAPAALGAAAPAPGENATAQGTKEPGAEQPAVSRGGVDRSRLAEVEDNRPLRRRAEEADAYYYLLNLARSADPENLESQARRDLSFAQLFTEPSRYRGELLYLEGVVRRVVQYPAGRNEYGVQTLYEAWLFTSDSHTNPYEVVCTHVPAEFPLGADIAEQVRVVGYFFKKNAYNAADGARVAPMILAHRLVWLRPPTAPSAGPPAFAIALWVAMGLGIVAVIFSALRRRRPSPSQQALKPRDDDVRGLGELKAGARPEEFLQELAEGRAEASSPGAGREVLPARSVEVAPPENGELE